MSTRLRSGIFTGARRACLWLALASGGCVTTRPDPLYQSFAEPPLEAHPFVRWWWNGGRVAAGEITRELDALKGAGFGGVEINTIAMPEATPGEALDRYPALPWLGPEWTQMVKVAAEAARARGLTADLIIGSGWPFGGRFLAPEEQIQRVRVSKRAVIGPQTLTLARADVLKDPEASKRKRNEPEVPPTRAALLSLRLVADGDGARFDPGQELLTPTAVNQDTFTIEVPAGPHTVFAVVHETGYLHVSLGAPGADGPVVDHLNAAAVRRYLDRLASTLGPSVGGQMGSALRALFVDSLELGHENWTTDFSAEFARRRGYAVEPYLPFLLTPEPRDAPSTPATDIVRRARYDMSRTVVELFGERFLNTVVAFCRANGVLARVQAYGREAHPLEGSLTPDVPEGETWLWADGDRVRSEVTAVNRYVGSAARLAGKRLVSFEAMTNTVPVFRETLADFKQAFDATLLAGLNHPIVHGFNYSPPEVGFPGWVRFGSYVSERNPLWAELPRWTTYAARLSSLLRQATPRAQVALLAPRADEWARFGLLYQPFPEPKLPAYQYQLPEGLASVGSSSDFISEALLQKASFTAGALLIGPRRYEALVLEDVQSLEPATAEVLARFAEAGGRIVFVGQAPSRAPGLRAGADGDTQVRSHIARAMRAGAERRVVVLPAPAPEQVLALAASALARVGVTPPLRLDPADRDVSQLRAEAGDREILLLVNRSRTQGKSLRFAVADPALAGRSLWRWDADTGGRAPWPLMTVGGTQAAPLTLGPEEAVLVVAEPAAAHPRASSDEAALRAAWAAPALASASGGVPIAGPWALTLAPMDGVAPFTSELPALVDLSRATDPGLARFAGVAHYRTTLTVPPGSSPTYLDLGRVEGVATVTVDGHAVGTSWYGAPVFSLGAPLALGPHQLDVAVTVGPMNYARSLKDINPVARRWAGWFPPIAAGLLGPVRLLTPGPS